MRSLAPVVEVACDYEGRIARDRVGHECEQAIDLPLTLRFPQAEVHAHRVEGGPRVLHVEHAMQQAPRLDSVHRHVDVLPVNDRKLRQQGVALVTAGRDDIPSVSVLGPHLVGQHLVLLLRNVLPVVAADFLQEDQVGPGRAQRFAHAGKQLAATERAEALVRVQRQEPYCRRARSAFTSHVSGHVCQPGEPDRSQREVR